MKENYFVQFSSRKSYKLLLAKFFLVGILLLIQLSASAQQERTISGSVTGVDKAPIAGVTVLVKGTTTGTLTDSEGRFSLAVPANALTLVVSFVGMTQQEIVLSSEKVYNIVLAENLIGLEEVLVIGYGTFKKRDLTGSVASVKSNRVENEKPQAIQDILRGNIAGMEVGFSTSAKGGGSLQIRGVNSLKTSTSPLIVLDGVIYQGGLEDINPYDIETIDVLKDASSAAVFGAKAANGVILITTKKGNQTRPIINFNSSIGLATMGQKSDLRTPEEFIAWRSDVMKSMNYYNASTNQKLYLFNNPSNLPEGVTLEMWLAGKTGDPLDIWLSRLGLGTIEIANYKANKTVDWENLVYQNGFRQDHNLSISGKKEETTYYWSIGYNNNEGIIVGDKFASTRSRLNLESKIGKWLNVGINTQFSHRNENNINADWGSAVRCPPYGSLYLDDGTTMRISSTDDLVGSKNPLYDMAFQTRLRLYNNIISNLYATIKLPLGISYQVTFAPRYQWYKYLNFQSSKHIEWATFGGQANREQSDIYSWQLDNLIKWNKTFNKIHKLDATFLINAEKYQSWENSMSAQGFAPSDALGYHSMNAGKSSSFSISSDDQYSTGDALMGRLFYSFMNKYMITLSVRQDGYSAFGQKNPRGVFPSAALGWVFTDENFLKNDIFYGKLRFSWGLNGNREIGRYDALALMGTGKYPYVSLLGTNYEVPVLYVTRMANTNLKWEKTKALNFGLDFSIRNGLFDGSIELYKKNTIDLLVDRLLPDITGFASVTSNLGEVQNTGLEIVLNTSIIDNEKLKWRSTLNFFLNRNKIIHLYGNMINITDAQGNVIGQREGDDITNKWFIGHDINQIWAPKVLGVWQIGEETEAAVFGQFPGDFKILDVNDDGKISQADNVFQGYKTARFIWNIRNDFNIYRNLDLSFLIYSYWGHYATFNNAKNSDGFPERNNSYSTPYWTPENPINDYSRIRSGAGGASFDVWREKSFIRLDNITLSYSIPSELVNKANISNLKFFGSIRNAILWTPKWKFWDPEYSGPNPRYFTFGVNLTI